jgi:hypothetical protein
VALLPAFAEGKIKVDIQLPEDKQSSTPYPRQRGKIPRMMIGEYNKKSKGVPTLKTGKR